jgi:hypothetical protein
MKNISLSSFLLGVCTASAAQTSSCTLGFYDPLAGSACVPAPVGSFVPSAGATEATLAPAGKFVNFTGSTVAFDAPPGFYVAAPGASSATPARLGRYVDTFGAVIDTPARLGHYVNVTGATAETPAPPGFYVATTAATAATPARLGHYVATSGAAADTPARLGHYVNVTGATVDTPAPPGYYVATTGATAATAAPLGSWVATAGASAPESARGFYTAAPAATAPIGAGMLAGPANLAVSAVRQILGARTTAENAPQGAGLAVSLLGGRESTEQDGITGGHRQRARATGFVLQGDTAPAAVGAHTLFLGVSEQRLDATAAGSAKASTWLAGWSTRIAGLRFTLFGGGSSADAERAVSEIATPELQTASTKTTLAGAQLGAALPLAALGAQLLLEGGVTSYRQKGFTETSAAAGTTAGLQVADWRHTAVPLFVGLSHSLGVAELSWGLRADLNGGSDLQASLTNGQVHSFAVPVGQASTKAFVAKLRFIGAELAPGLRLGGGVALEAGDKTRQSQAQVTLDKRW